MLRRLIPVIAALIAAIVIGIINPDVPGETDALFSRLRSAQEVGPHTRESR